jgi:hypothetical protein
MSANSASDALHKKVPLSPAERSRLYRRGLRVGTQSIPITITDERIEGLVKRGYLGSSERDDLSAIQQAISLFVWDTLRKVGSRKKAKSTTN